MGQRFEHNGIEYEEMGDGKVRVIGPARGNPAPFTAVPLPLSPEQQAEEDRRRRDQAIQEQAARDKADADARARHEWIATHNPDGSLKEKPPEGYRVTPDGNLEFIPGGPADPAKSGKSLRQGDSDKLRAAVNQFADMSRIRSNFQKNYGGNAAGGLENWAQGFVSGIGTPGQRDWWSDMATMDNVIRNDLFGASLTEGEKQAYARTTITPGMDAREIEKNLARRQDVMRGALQRYINGLKAGGWSGTEIDAIVGDQAPNLYPQGPRADEQQARNAIQQDTTGSADNRLASPGDDRKAIPIPPEMQAEYEQYVQANRGNLDPSDYARFRQGLDEKYGFGTGDAQTYATEAQRLNDTVNAGGNLDLRIPSVTKDLTGWESLHHRVASHPVGAFAASMGNAGGLGIPSLLAGDQMDALRDANPVSTTLGDIAGGVTGAMTAGAGLRGVARIPGVTDDVVRLISNPVTADVAYGTVYGATQADDPLYGAVGGAGAALAGNVIGNHLGRVLPGWLGFNPASPLSRGEQAVLRAAERTGVDDVAAALIRAQDLNVPASLADVSMDINSLTGAAVRRSPVAAALARDTLGARSRGQFDRFVGAVERDLGPVENIPQRSEDLITQARTAAGPHYDAAYAAPGASVLDLSDLMARPSMPQALARARRIAAEEGRDPDALGIVFGPDGAVTLRQPSWQTLDYVKRGLDDVLEGYRDSTTGRLNLDAEGRAVNGTLQDLLQRMDTMNPDYAAARAAYAGPAAERDALARGQAAIRMSPDRLGVNFNNATPAQQAQMRLGAQSQLVENAGRLRYSSNPFESILGTPAMEQRLATLYPEGSDTNIARLLLQRDIERDLAASSNRLIGNSMTAERALADEAFAQGGGLGDAALEIGANVALGQVPIGTAIRGVLSQGVRDQFRLGIGRRGRELAEEVAPLTLETTEDAIARILSMRQRSQAHQQVLEALMDSRGVTGGHIGAGTGSAVAAALMRD